MFVSKDVGGSGGPDDNVLGFRYVRPLVADRHNDFVYIVGDATGLTHLSKIAKVVVDHADPETTCGGNHTWSRE